MSALAHARSFLEIGGAVSALRNDGAHATTVELWATDGTPVAVVDDVPSPPTPVEARLDYLRAGFRFDPLRAAMRVQRAPVGSEIIPPARYDAIVRELGWRGPLVHPLCVPLVDDSGVIGALRAGFEAPVPDAVRGEVVRLGAHVSIRLAKLGIGAAEDGSVLGGLTTRQLQVARLATLDRTNREIADELDLSIDTVKKHLKDAFARLSITSRRDLRALFARLTPVTEMPPGVTYRDGLWLTRLDLGDRDTTPLV